MFARVTKIHVKPEKVEQMRRWRATPELQAQPGFKGAYVLVDEKNSAGMTVFFWETEKAMLDSAEIAKATRAQVAKDMETTGAAEVEMYEVVAQP